MLALLGASLVTFCFFIIESVLTTPILDNQEGSFSAPAIYKRRATGNVKDDNTVSGVLLATSQPSEVTNDFTYLCPITIGGQTLNLDFDTGSPNFWVLSVLLSDQKQGNNYYDPQKSKTYQRTGTKFEVEYYDGSIVSGSGAIDTLSIFDIQVKNQYFGLASKIEGEFVGDGIIGLGFHDIKSKRKPTFFDNLRTYLKAPIFGVYLPWRVSGFYDFGVIHSSRYTQSIQYAPVNSANGVWELDTPSYKVGDTVYPSKSQTGYADTGNARISMQKEQVKNYYNSVKGSYIAYGIGWVFPCSSTLPDLSIAVGNGDDYITIAGGVDIGILNIGPLPDNDEICEGAIQTAPDSMNVYGLPLFNSYYVIFDAVDKDNLRIGFAKINTPIPAGSPRPPGRPGSPNKPAN